ncbi:hypothetical protein [Halobellus rubicundus]|uniref:Uncharacterized protein n=1 Tax=Halobellus rubicundus TaxID=2996466 RepID=A0ABD5MC56_9EURY
MPADDPAAAETPSPYPDALPLSPRAERLLLGPDPATAVRLSAVAGVLFVVTFVVHLPPRLVGGLSFPFGLLLPLLVGVAFVAAAVGAYRNDGLFVCLALAGGPSFGFYLPLGLFDLTYPSATMLNALAIGVTLSVVVGTAGFVVGAGGRRLVEQVA